MVNLMKCRMFNSLIVMASLTCPGCDVHTNINDMCFECDKESNESETVINKDNNRKSLRGKSTKKRRRAITSTVDSGATIHCIKDKHLFTHMNKDHKVRLKVANGKIMHGEGVGDCIMKLTGDDGKLHDVVLHNCVYSPHFSANDGLKGKCDFPENAYRLDDKQKNNKNVQKVYIKQPFDYSVFIFSAEFSCRRY